jgi:hypothetical protein
MPGNEAEAVSLVDAYLERAAVRDNRATVDTPVQRFQRCQAFSC